MKLTEKELEIVKEFFSKASSCALCGSTEAIMPDEIFYLISNEYFATGKGILDVVFTLRCYNCGRVDMINLFTTKIFTEEQRKEIFNRITQEVIKAKETKEKGNE